MATHSEAEESFLNAFENDERNYKKIDVIRSGAYGTVYKAKALKTNDLVSVHVLKVQLSENGFPASTLKEINCLKKLTFHHPNVVQLLDIGNGRYVRQHNQLLLPFVFEHVEENLAGFLEKCPAPGLGSETIKFPSLWYCPPEVLLQQSHVSSVEIWSAGCIIAELFKGKPLFVGENELDQLTKIFEVIGSPPEAEWPQDASIAWSSFDVYQGVPLPTVIPNISEDGTDLIKSMLTFKAEARISLTAALCHSYCRGYLISRMPPQCILFGTSSASSLGSKQSRE